MTRWLSALIVCFALAACQTSFEQPASLIAHAPITNQVGVAVGQARVFERSGVRTINLATTQAQPGIYRVTTIAGQITNLPSLTVSEDGIGSVSDRLPASLSGRVEVRLGEALVSRIDLPE